MEVGSADPSMRDDGMDMNWIKRKGKGKPLLGTGIEERKERE